MIIISLVTMSGFFEKYDNLNFRPREFQCKVLTIQLLQTVAIQRSYALSNTQSKWIDTTGYFSQMGTISNVVWSELECWFSFCWKFRSIIGFGRGWGGIWEWIWRFCRALPDRLGSFSVPDQSCGLFSASGRSGSAPNPKVHPKIPPNHPKFKVISKTTS